MNKNLSIFGLVLAIAVIGLAIWPISGNSSAADTPFATPTVFLADMNSQVCASQSPVHTTASLTTVEADSNQGDTMPSIFLVMLDDGVCASLSPISISSRSSVPTDPEKDDELFAGLNANSPKKTRFEIETGVWYVQQ